MAYFKSSTKISVFEQGRKGRLSHYYSDWCPSFSSDCCPLKNMCARKKPRCFPNQKTCWQKRDSAHIHSNQSGKVYLVELLLFLHFFFLFFSIDETNAEHNELFLIRVRDILFKQALFMFSFYRTSGLLLYSLIWSQCTLANVLRPRMTINSNANPLCNHLFLNHWREYILLKELFISLWTTASHY